MVKKKAPFRQIIVTIIFLLCIIIFLFYHKYSQLRLFKCGLNIKIAVSDILNKYSITDSNIVSQWAHEKSKYDVEYYMEIQLPKSANVDKICAEILSAVKDTKSEVYFCQKKQNYIKYIFAKNNRPLFTLLLHLPARVKVAIVIDDLGWLDISYIKPFISLGIPMTFTILPEERYSIAVLNEILSLKKYPVLLHLPLEPVDRNEIKNKKTTLLTHISDNELVARVKKYISSLPGIVGVNNHTGSKFLQDEHKMEVLLSLIKEEKLFFLDSGTTNRSVAKKVSQKIGFVGACLQNDIIFDVQDDTATIQKNLYLLMNVALKKGAAIGIGHIHKKYVTAVLAQMIPIFQQKGIEFVPITDLLDQTYPRANSPGPGASQRKKKSARIPPLDSERVGNFSTRSRR